MFEPTLDELECITLRRFVPEDAPQMVDLQRRTLAKCYDISLLPEGFYHSPGFNAGANILCAVDGTGTHVGHALVTLGHVHRGMDAWLLWMDLRVDPALETADRPVGAALRDRLLAAVTVRASELAAELDKPAMLYATYFDQGHDSIAYLASRGFVPFEHIVQLRRSLELPIPELLQPAGVMVRPWRMETEAEQLRYLAAYDDAFANQGKRLAELQHFMASPAWADGTTITAFDGDEVVGSVMAYYQADRDRNPDRVGATEYVFVRPAWQRRGIARYLLGEALSYLRSTGMAYASLEVLTDNAPALALYESLGYTRWRGEISLGQWLTAKEGDAHGK